MVVSNRLVVLYNQQKNIQGESIMCNDKERLEFRKKIAEVIKNKIVDINAKLDTNVQDDEDEESEKYAASLKGSEEKKEK